MLHDIELQTLLFQYKSMMVSWDSIVVELIFHANKTDNYNFQMLTLSIENILLKV